MKSAHNHQMDNSYITTVMTKAGEKKRGTAVFMMGFIFMGHSRFRGIIYNTFFINKMYLCF